VRELRRRAWERWQRAAGPWRRWGICPALLVPDTNGASEAASPSGDVPARLARQRAQTLAIGMAAHLRDGGTAVVVDLEPVLGVHVAAELNRRRLAQPVLILPRWPYREAVLPVDTLVPALIDRSRHLVLLEQAMNVVFVLDALRSQPVTRRKKTDPRADNRYQLSAADLPNLATLRRAGITRVLKVTGR
jgi:hypothetical protein